nr:MAG TPA: hypothetical protein [Crassvirales sp.]
MKTMLCCFIEKRDDQLLLVSLCYMVLPVHLVMVFSPLVSWNTMKLLGSMVSPSSPLNLRSSCHDT